MHSVHRLFFALLLMSLLAACATLSPNYQTPQVSVTSFTIAPESAGTPIFNIGLRVVNPNRVALPLQGMTYSVEIEGNRILSGAEPNLPTIKAYETADFVIQASPDLLGSIRLLNQLMTEKKGYLEYALKAQLDVGTLLPLIPVEEVGRFNYSTK